MVLLQPRRHEIESTEGHLGKVYLLLSRRPRKAQTFFSWGVVMLGGGYPDATMRKISLSVRPLVPNDCTETIN